MLTRRHWLRQGAGLAGAATVGLAQLARAQAGKPFTMSYGWVPWAAGNSPITQHMINKKLIEKHAAEFGYDLTMDYRAYPAAAPQVEALAAGQLDIPDTQLAAAQFLEMSHAPLIKPMFFMANKTGPSPERIRVVAESAVKLFMAGYGVKK
jgi:ABC-type nitrate/sulfonate/bicarbonate transport system substrate-binding protein